MGSTRISGERYHFPARTLHARQMPHGTRTRNNAVHTVRNNAKIACCRFCGDGAITDLTPHSLPRGPEAQQEDQSDSLSSDGAPLSLAATSHKAESGSGFQVLRQAAPHMKLTTRPLSELAGTVVSSVHRGRNVLREGKNRTRRGLSIPTPWFWLCFAGV